jgi:DNA-directed RNA polymerase, mitochondrial
MAFADDPLCVPRFWGEADKPWTFLAACKEWKRYREEGPDFRSHLPVSMDGTCNGYQHLSAMGRDPIGGLATNLVPAGEPQDIYQKVADRANRRIERDAENGGPDADAARQLLGKIDRNDAKHATMTTPYGVTRGTIYKQLLETKPAKDCNDPKKCALYLARVFSGMYSRSRRRSGQHHELASRRCSRSREGESGHGVDNTGGFSCGS